MSTDQDELQLELNEEEEATVELDDDGKKAELVKEPPPEVTQEAASKKDEAPTEAELDTYSKRVEKRIDKLTARMREHQRREEAALEYARSVQKQNEELQARYAQSDTARRGEARGRLDSQILALKNVIKRAREEADIDTETEAQQRLTQALWEQRRLADAEEEARRAPAAPRQQEIPPQLRQPAPVVDEKAEDWAERNPWFGKNIVMTNAVRGIHVELVKNEGFDPSSDEYYDEIDRRMQSIFPQAYSAPEDAQPAQQSSRSSRPASTVAPATRSSGVNSTARRTVKLKPSEVAIAKQLGVPLEEYAKYVKR